MAHEIDELLTKIKDLSRAINDPTLDQKERDHLEAGRSRLRAQAASLAVQGRHPQSVEREIEAIEHRLSQIETMRIKEGYQERRGGKHIQDPGAYSSSINRLLNEQHAAEVASLTEQLEVLRSRTESNDSR